MIDVKEFLDSDVTKMSDDELNEYMNHYRSLILDNAVYPHLYDTKRNG